MRTSPWGALTTVAAVAGVDAAAPVVAAAVAVGAVAAIVAQVSTDEAAVMIAAAGGTAEGHVTGAPVHGVAAEVEVEAVVTEAEGGDGRAQLAASNREAGDSRFVQVFAAVCCAFNAHKYWQKLLYACTFRRKYA